MTEKGLAIHSADGTSGMYAPRGSESLSQFRTVGNWGDERSDDQVSSDMSPNELPWNLSLVNERIPDDSSVKEEIGRAIKVLRMGPSFLKSQLQLKGSNSRYLQEMKVMYDNEAFHFKKKWTPQHNYLRHRIEAVDGVLNLKEQGKVTVKEIKRLAQCLMEREPAEGTSAPILEAVFFHVLGFDEAK